MATRYPGNDTNQTESTLKILFVGDAEVGKTSVIRSICGEDFRGTYSNTIGKPFPQDELKRMLAERNLLKMSSLEQIG